MLTKYSLRRRFGLPHRPPSRHRHIRLRKVLPLLLVLQELDSGSSQGEGSQVDRQNVAKLQCDRSHNSSHTPPTEVVI